MKLGYNSGMDTLKNGYHSPSLGDLPISKVISEIGDFVDEEPSGFYSLIIGTDSQTKRINGTAEIDFVTAIVIYRKGRGARDMIREVVGMVTGNGYVAKTKPESWGASTVADKHT